ncbi:ABC transporter ATP-binding protein [Wenzhouxiangella marina]|uniref:Methionine ABC transporter ATP-binding protein n=1 Tax=Wenzhouxiangella marina TaxID=1579979 RepID=A0A0K0XRY0_9GAMM|nr:ABC transporter ATP-binding protein [Wenzhouxiangella marina]AKS40410.1 methionine ABC transporter ATP-binding protein [Wenzhouxiangella marina]MBB6088268.1 putative ABC transport system ATP-binding protein [Wenzhouxiangella marina]
MSLLELENLRFTWPGADRPVLIMNRLNIEAGQKVFLHGPSGTGKSTLLALIGGLVRPEQGRIELMGQDLVRLSGPKRDRMRADHLGVIFQQFNLLPWLDVLSNVTLPCRFSKARAGRAGAVEQAARDLLQAMDLAPALCERKAGQLSVGQQQRVAAARALIGRPELILADEPTSALDADRRSRFIDLLFEQASAAGSALLFVSHDLALAERFDRQLSLPELNRAEVMA